MSGHPDRARLRDLAVFGEIAAAEIPALGALVDGLDLSLLDCLTIRDLCSLSGLRSDAALFAVLAAMFAKAAEGSLCLDVTPAALTCFLAAGCGEEFARQMAQDFHRRLSEGRYRSLVDEKGDAYLPLVLVRGGRGGLLYFQRFFCHEKRLQERLGAYLENPVPRWDQPPAEIVDKLYCPGLCLRQTAGGQPLEKDPRQTAALRCCLEKRFTVISGGPGTGKTSLMVNLVRALVRAGVPADRILLGAPTGRAAQRMSEALQHYLGTIREPDDDDRSLAGLGGSTLHKMLGYRPGRNDFRYNCANPLPAEAVVLDEVSMVDVVMMDHFLQAVDPRRTRLILLGDRDQLPSVEAGAVFASMIPRQERDHRFREHLVLLEKIYRSGKRLAELAAALNAGRFPEKAPGTLESALAMPEDDWCRVPYGGAGRWRRDQSHWLRHQYLQPPPAGGLSFRDTVTRSMGRSPAELVGTGEGRALLQQLFRQINGCRILTLVRRGPLGCETINRRLAAEMSLAVEGAAATGGLFSGALVLITRNDYGRQLFNGDLGVALRDDEGRCRVYFQRAGAFVAFSRHQLPAWEFGYAVTVHKSQGSEFDDVLLVLPDDENHRLLFREIVYTGVTRARRRVILYGKRRVLERALSRRSERTSGLVWQAGAFPSAGI